MITFPRNPNISLSQWLGSLHASRHDQTQVLFQPQLLPSIGEGLSQPGFQQSSQTTEKPGIATSMAHRIPRWTKNNAPKIAKPAFISINTRLCTATNMTWNLPGGQQLFFFFSSGLFLTWLLYQSSRFVVLKHVSVDNWSSVREEGGCGLFVDVNIAVIIWFHFQKYVRYSGILCKNILRSTDFQWELLAEKFRYFERFYSLYVSIWHHLCVS